MNILIKNNCTNLITFDIEDWFHILDISGQKAIGEWDQYESMVGKNSRKILSLLDRYNVKATFFILGWIAERYPKLVQEIFEHGHEIASHGYAHELVTDLSKDKFRKDLLKSRQVLKNITHEYPVSYRCPGFSITRENDWALEEIANCGFKYDASIYPGKHGHGGHSKFGSDPVEIKFQSNGKKLIEYPVSVAKVFKKKMCFSGGGYLRFLPLSIINRKFQEFNKYNNPVMVYMHPREFDPEGPRLKMPFVRHIKCYINTKSTENKLEYLLKNYYFTSILDYSKQHSIQNSIKL